MIMVYHEEKLDKLLSFFSYLTIDYVLDRATFS